MCVCVCERERERERRRVCVTGGEGGGQCVEEDEAIYDWRLRTATLSALELAIDHRTATGTPFFVLSGFRDPHARKPRAQFLCGVFFSFERREIVRGGALGGVRANARGRLDEKRCGFHATRAPQLIQSPWAAPQRMYDLYDEASVAVAAHTTLPEGAPLVAWSNQLDVRLANGEARAACVLFGPFWCVASV